MDPIIPNKSYFRIGEVSRIVGVEPYVVRYWETEFKAIKPARSTSDQRLYQRKDIELLLLIKELLYTKGFTIAGARQKLRAMRKGAVAEEPQDLDERLSALKKGLQELKKMVS